MKNTIPAALLALLTLPAIAAGQEAAKPLPEIRARGELIVSLHG
jgi:hypothetical protein